MNQSTRSRTRPRSVLRWVITIAWIVLGSALAFMCIKVFGDNLAEIGVPALVVAGALIWYFTERRDRNKPGEHQSDLVPTGTNNNGLRPGSAQPVGEEV